MRAIRRVCAAGLLLAVAAAEPAWTQSPPAKASEEVPFNPYLAEKDLEVGKYYLKEKNYDAAIARFGSAIRNKPNFAMPHRLLGEAYEKKGQREDALRYYRKYLEILPAAQDAKKIEKRIQKLEAALKRTEEKRKALEPPRTGYKPVLARLRNLRAWAKWA